MACARIRCAAFDGAKAAKLAAPRQADVFPVTMIAPRPAASMRGTIAWPRSMSDSTLVRNVCSRASGATSRNSPKWPLTALWTSTLGVPRSEPILSTTSFTRAASVTSTA